MSKDIHAERSSGNILADSGRATPEKHPIKSTVVLATAKIIRERELPQE